MSPNEDSVMILEDDLESRTYLTQLLEVEGFKIVAFSDGAEALDYLMQSEAPCLIILDIRMPVMDGARFRSAMLSEPRLAKIPVVIVTAFEPPSAAKLAAVRVFRKPVDVDALLRTIRANC
jgi:CheY-like chemotaxis protein